MSFIYEMIPVRRDAATNKLYVDPSDISGVATYSGRDQADSKAYLFERLSDIVGVSRAFPGTYHEPDYDCDVPTDRDGVPIYDDWATPWPHYLTASMPD